MIGGSDPVQRPDPHAPSVAIEQAADSGLLRPGARVLLALSGGRDSASLLHALRMTQRWSLTAAVVDHALHPASRAHARSAVRYAAALGVDARILAVAPEEFEALARRDGPEGAARTARYRLLRAHAAALGAMYIVTAHTADDQAETLLMRLGEGTGLHGAAGIPVENGLIVRPWLTVARADVAAYAAEHDVDVIEDPSNSNARFLRNAVRRSVMPAMAATLGPRWVARAARTARNLGDEVELVECLLDRMPDLIERRGDSVRVSHEGRAGWSVGAQRALIDRALRVAGAAGRRRGAAVRRIVELSPGERLSLPGGWIARSTAEAIIIEPARMVRAAPRALHLEQAAAFAWGDWSFEVVQGRRADDPSAVALAVEAAPLPWTVRCVAVGDRLRPRGAPGSKSVRRLWSDRRTARRWRSALPVIESRGRVVWAAGLRADESVRVAPGAQAWLLRVLEPADGPGLYPTGDEIRAGQG